MLFSVNLKAEIKFDALRKANDRQDPLHTQTHTCQNGRERKKTAGVYTGVRVVMTQRVWGSLNKKDMETTWLEKP